MNTTEESDLQKGPFITNFDCRLDINPDCWFEVQLKRPQCFFSRAEQWNTAGEMIYCTHFMKTYWKGSRGNVLVHFEQ